MYKCWVVIAVLLVPACVWAGTPINERRALAADASVSVNNLAGLIEVVAWEWNEIAITGELGEDVEELEISGDAQQLRIDVRYPHNTRGGVEETMLRLQLPRTVVLALETVSADIRVEGMQGALTANSVSGDVRLRVQSAEVDANTVSGDIELNAPAHQTQLQSVSGDIKASGLRGSFKAETVSGDLRLDGRDFGSVAAQTVSGDLILRLGLDAGAKLGAETLSGDITVHLQRPPDARVTLKTFSGGLSSAFGAQAATAARKLEQTLGSGRGVIELSSFSGDIRLGR